MDRESQTSRGGEDMVSHRCVMRPGWGYYVCECPIGRDHPVDPESVDLEPS